MWYWAEVVQVESYGVKVKYASFILFLLASLLNIVSSVINIQNGNMSVGLICVVASIIWMFFAWSKYPFKTNS
jgi:hypothetical protein